MASHKEGSRSLEILPNVGEPVHLKDHASAVWDSPDFHENGVYNKHPRIKNLSDLAIWKL